MSAKATADPAINRVMSLVASVYDVPHRDLARRRSNRLALPRAVAIYLAHTMLSMSLSQIGEVFRRHPTTAFYAVRRIEALRDRDVRTDQMLNWLESLLHDAKEAAHDRAR
jgi:chromosomal replication initiator protein